LKAQNLHQLSYISESNMVPNPMSLNSNTNGYFNTMPAAAVYMRFDERKWASTLVKVYRHMRLLERSKYLEPFFS
jgi:phosphoserine aminotransferase